MINYYLKKELNEYNTNPEKIDYITFSKAAAEEAEETSPKVGTKTIRLLKMPTIKLERPNPRTTKIEKSPWL